MDFLEREREGRQMTRSPLAAARRVVVKIGSSLLTNAGAGLDRDAIADWARQIARSFASAASKCSWSPRARSPRA